MKHYAFIKFSVVNYEVGQTASDAEVEYIKGCGWREWRNEEDFYSHFNKDGTAAKKFKAIIGMDDMLDINKGNPFANEISLTGFNYFMEGNEDALDEIADTAVSGSDWEEVVTLWSLYYDEYTDWESWYPEYEIIVEYHGIVTAELMGKLEKMLMEKDE